MKLIIDIPKVMYVNAQRDLLFGADILVKAIKNGTPLDDVKAEIQTKEMVETNIEKQFYNMALTDTIQILDNIGNERRCYE